MNDKQTTIQVDEQLAYCLWLLGYHLQQTNLSHQDLRGHLSVKSNGWEDFKVAYKQNNCATTILDQIQELLPPQSLSPFQRIEDYSRITFDLSYKDDGQEKNINEINTLDSLAHIIAEQAFDANEICIEVWKGDTSLGIGWYSISEDDLSLQIVGENYDAQGLGILLNIGYQHYWKDLD